MIIMLTMPKFKIICFSFVLITIIFLVEKVCAESAQHLPPFSYQLTDIPLKVQTTMRQYTWRPGCPVPMSDLSYLTLSYWGFDHQKHTGVMVVNKAVAKEVIAIFEELYYQRFPIERMQLMDTFKGDDDSAMAANNTSSFNCRAKTGKPGEFSVHSYGRAIDINPLINPYINGNTVIPSRGRAYLDRTIPMPGKILMNDDAYNAFVKRGWTWGGS